MATALDIITRSLRLLGVYSIAEAPSAEEAADALQSLNSMIDSWAGENLFVFAQSVDVIALTPGQLSYTIGPSGATVTTRPVKVLASSYIDFQGVSYPLTVDTLADYNAIPLKTQVQGIPSELYVWDGMPNVTAKLWPVPSDAMTLNLWSNKLLQSFAALTDVLTLPPGYERALTFSLAEELAPEYQLSASVDIQKKAMHARKVLKRTNTEVPRLRMPYGVPMNRVLGGNFRIG